ncbi:hypothetical protein JCM8202v2_004775 [Rhodotorula sphaerocarpa]
MNSLAHCDLSDLDLPFQLPPSSSEAAHSPAPRPPSPPAVAPSPRPAVRPAQRPLAPPRSFEGVYVPHAKSCTCGCRSSPRLRPPTVRRSSPAMARKKRAAPADPAPPLAPAPPQRNDSSASGAVPEAPLKALPWLHHGSPEPPTAGSTSYGTRSGRAGRTSALPNPVSAPSDSPRVTRQQPLQPAQPPQHSSGSLKIVLKAPKRTAPPPTSLPTPVSSASPPVVVLDSTAPSEASSRSESPAVGPTLAATAAIEPPAASLPVQVVQTTALELGTPNGVVAGSPTGMASAERSASRKGNKTGRDGLNRVCHHHKSQTDRPRMIYLAYTPNTQFETGLAFTCPVCQDVCLCAGCKRKRRGLTKDGRRPQAEHDIVVALPRPGAPAVLGGEEKAAKRGRRKKSRESGNAVVDSWTPNVHGWGPSPLPQEDIGSDSSDDDADVSRMLIGDNVGGRESGSMGPSAPAPTAAAEDSTLVAKRRSSLSSAYDRENPLTFPAAGHQARPEPQQPPTVRKSGSNARRRSSAASGRNRTESTQHSTSAANDYSHYHTVSIFASGPQPGESATDSAVAAVSGRPKRNKRPSTAFDDYAVDFATSAAAGLVDRSASPGPLSFAAGTTTSAGPGGRKRPSAAAARSSGIERLSLEHFAPSRKIPRRWRSELSSASDCDGSAYSSMDEDSDGELANAEPGHPPKGVVEQPLPVLAGLERNLGIEPPSGEHGEPTEEPLAFGEAFVGVVPALFDLDGGDGTRRKVRWIEGPERRKRRAMAAAAAGHTPDENSLPVKSASAPPAIKVETTDSDDVIAETPPMARSVSPSDPPQLFSPAPLKRSTSLPPDPLSRPALKQKEDRPDLDQASTTALVSSASSDSSSGNRSAKDTKLAFALLDAVRAAVGVTESPARAGTSSGGIGAALQAALTTGSKEASSSKAEDSDSMPVEDAENSARDDAPKVPADVEIDYAAHELEAMRRLEALAAQEKVDPGKAFKPTARDGAEAQLFIGSPVCNVDGDDESVSRPGKGGDPDAQERLKFGFEVSFNDADAVSPEFDAGSPIDDLWTPASAADSLSTAPSTSASNSFGDDPLCSRTVPTSNAPGEPTSPALADEYPLFAAAVVGGLTPPHNGSTVAVPRTPTRGLLASGALCGLDDLDGLGASGMTIPLATEDTWMDDREPEIEAF